MNKIKTIYNGVEFFSLEEHGLNLKMNIITSRIELNETLTLILLNFSNSTLIFKISNFRQNHEE